MTSGSRPGGSPVVIEPMLARLLIAVLLLAPTIANAGNHTGVEVDFSAIARFDTAYELEGDRLQKSELSVTTEFNVEFSPSISLTFIGRLRFEGEDLLEPGQPAQSSVSEASQRRFLSNHVEWDLRELYLDLELGNAFVRIGKQQIVWGQADGLKVLDVVNPQTFREFILPEFEGSRIPLWTVNVEVPFAGGTLQALWIPDQSYNDLPEPGAAFEITAPFVGIPPSVPVTIAPYELPNRFFEDSDVGLRYSLFVGGWDVTLNYLYHYHDLPVIRRAFTPNGLLLSPSYERTHLVGGTIANAFGNFTVRGEVGWSSDAFFAQTLAAPGDGVHKSPELSSVIGLDYSGLTDTFVSAQLFQSTVLDHNDTVQRSKTEMTASLLLRRNFANQTVQAQVLWIQSLSDDGALVRPSLRVDYSTELQFELYADFFFGDRAGLFGQFDARDRIGITLTRSF